MKNFTTFSCNLQEDKTSIELDTQVGTLNFMSPEAFQDISHAPRFDSTGRNAKPRMKVRLIRTYPKNTSLVELGSVLQVFTRFLSARHYPVPGVRIVERQRKSGKNERRLFLPALSLAIFFARAPLSERLEQATRHSFGGFRLGALQEQCFGTGSLIINEC